MPIETRRREDDWELYKKEHKEEPTLRAGAFQHDLTLATLEKGPEPPKLARWERQGWGTYKAAWTAYTVDMHAMHYPHLDRIMQLGIPAGKLQECRRLLRYRKYPDGSRGPSKPTAAELWDLMYGLWEKKEVGVSQVDWRKVRPAQGKDSVTRADWEEYIRNLQREPGRSPLVRESDIIPHLQTYIPEWMQRKVLTSLAKYETHFKAVNLTGIATKYPSLRRLREGLRKYDIDAEVNQYDAHSAWLTMPATDMESYAAVKRWDGKPAGNDLELHVRDAQVFPPWTKVSGWILEHLRVSDTERLIKEGDKAEKKTVAAMKGKNTDQKGSKKKSSSQQPQDKKKTGKKDEKSCKKEEKAKQAGEEAGGNKGVIGSEVYAVKGKGKKGKGGPKDGQYNTYAAKGQGKGSTGGPAQWQGSPNQQTAGKGPAGPYQPTWYTSGKGGQDGRGRGGQQSAAWGQPQRGPFYGKGQH